MLTWSTSATRLKIDSEAIGDQCSRLAECCDAYLLPFEGLTEVSADDQSSFQLQDVVLFSE